MKWSIVLIALLLATSVGHADPVSAKRWVEECSVRNPRTPEQTGAVHYCYGFTRGLADGIRLSRLLSQEVPICVPAEPSAGDLRDLGLLYYKNNPKDRHLGASVMLTLAFQEAWPCPTQPRTSFKENEK